MPLEYFVEGFGRLLDFSGIGNRGFRFDVPENNGFLRDRLAFASDREKLACDGKILFGKEGKK